MKQADDKASAIVELREGFYAEDSGFPAMNEADFPGPCFSFLVLGSPHVTLELELRLAPDFVPG